MKVVTLRGKKILQLSKVEEDTLKHAKMVAERSAGIAWAYENEAVDQKFSQLLSALNEVLETDEFILENHNG